MASARSIVYGIRHIGAGFLPAMGRPAAPEVLLSGVGVTLCVLVAAGFIALSPASVSEGVFLIAPIGASALLVVAVPNSPLSQPWSVLVGNAGAAVIGVAAVQMIPWLPIAAAVAVGGSVIFMLLARALHPPAGGMALATVLSSEAVADLGFRFALTPVALDSALLLFGAILWNRATGRVYPFRRPGGPTDPLASGGPTGRDGLTEADLAVILRRLRLSANVGVADFGRMIAAVDEIAAADRSCAGLTCAQVMTVDPVAVGPETPLARATALLLSHNIHSLPVIDPEGAVLGIVSQAILLRATIPRAVLDQTSTPTSHTSADRAAANLRQTGAPSAFTPPGRAAAPAPEPRETSAPLLNVSSPSAAHQAGKAQKKPLPTGVETVAGVMTRAVVTVNAEDPLAVALSALAGGGYQSVPVLRDNRLVGIISRSDLIDVLAHRPA